MSSYLVSKETIDAIVYGARLWHKEPVENPGDGLYAWPTTNASKVGSYLWRYNAMALADRYGDPIPKCVKDYQYGDGDDRVSSIILNTNGRSYSIGEVYGSLRCYMYQTSDWSGWDDSSLRLWCDGFMNDLLDACMARLGEDVPWGIEDDEDFDC